MPAREMVGVSCERGGFDSGSSSYEQLPKLVGRVEWALYNCILHFDNYKVPMAEGPSLVHPTTQNNHSLVLNKKSHVKLLKINLKH